MKIKEKFGKQNNSVKGLLKKLKWHEIKVMAATLVICSAACGGVVYFSTPMVVASTKQSIEKDKVQSEKITTERLNEFYNELSELDKIVSDNYTELSSYYNENEENGKLMSESVSEQVVTIKSNLGTIHDCVTSTQGKIEELKTSLEGNNQTVTQQMQKDFAQVQTSLDTIQTSYDTAQADTKKLMEEVKTDLSDENTQLSTEMTENYNSLLTTLGDMDTSMENYNQALLSEFQTDFSQMNTDMTTGFSDLTQYVGDCMNGVNSKLDQVFQYVSNGKKMLASALLTKNVSISEDATFADIKQAIESIPQTIVLDDGTSASNVAYDYHYHLDGNGNILNSQMVDESHKGGCYTKAVTHVHTDACYSGSFSYSYITQKDVKQGNKVGVYYTGENMFNYECQYCGYSWVGTNPNHHESSKSRQVAESRSRSDTEISTVDERVLTCTKQAGVYVEGYTTECGYTHGQVVAAHISFDSNTTFTSSSNAPGGVVLTDEMLKNSNIQMNTGTLANIDYVLNEQVEQSFNTDGTDDEAAAEASAGASSSAEDGEETGAQSGAGASNQTGTQTGTEGSRQSGANGSDEGAGESAKDSSGQSTANGSQTSGSSDAATGSDTTGSDSSSSNAESDSNAKENSNEESDKTDETTGEESGSTE